MQRCDECEWSHRTSFGWLWFWSKNLKKRTHLAPQWRTQPQKESVWAFGLEHPTNSLLFVENCQWKFARVLGGTPYTVTGCVFTFNILMNLKHCVVYSCAGAVGDVYGHLEWSPSAFNFFSSRHRCEATPSRAHIAGSPSLSNTVSCNVSVANIISIGLPEQLMLGGLRQVIGVLKLFGNVLAMLLQCGIPSVRWCDSIQAQHHCKCWAVGCLFNHVISLPVQCAEGHMINRMWTYVCHPRIAANTVDDWAVSAHRMPQKGGSG